MIEYASYSLEEKQAMLDCYNMFKQNPDRAARGYAQYFPHFKQPSKYIFAMVKYNWVKYGQFDPPDQQPARNQSSRF